jgi:hypothetical protein
MFIVWASFLVGVGRIHDARHSSTTTTRPQSPAAQARSRPRRDELAERAASFADGDVADDLE